MTYIESKAVYKEMDSSGDEKHCFCFRPHRNPFSFSLHPVWQHGGALQPTAITNRLDPLSARRPRWLPG